MLVDFSQKMEDLLEDMRSIFARLELATTSQPTPFIDSLTFLSKQKSFCHLTCGEQLVTPTKPISDQPKVPEVAKDPYPRLSNLEPD